MSNIEIKERAIVDGRQLRAYDLYIDGIRRAAAEQQLSGRVWFRFDPVGTFSLAEAQVWLQGLLELNIIAEELMHGKKTTKNQ